MMTDSEATCRHHWLLSQPEAASVRGVCRRCGASRVFPAALDDYDWAAENESRYLSEGVATAAGGARPSSGALPVDQYS